MKGNDVKREKKRINRTIKRLVAKRLRPDEAIVQLPGKDVSITPFDKKAYEEGVAKGKAELEEKLKEERQKLKAETKKIIKAERNNAKMVKLYPSSEYQPDAAGFIEPGATLGTLKKYEGADHHHVPYEEVNMDYEHTVPEVLSVPDLVHSYWLRGALHHYDAYFFARMFPGTVATPLIHSNEPVPAHNALAHAVSTKPSTNSEWLGIYCCSTYGSMFDAAGIRYVTGTSTFNTLTTTNALLDITNLTTEPWTNWYGSSPVSFTSGTIFWSTQIDLSLECALASLSGTAYVGAVSLGQWISGLPVTALLARAERTELKATTGRVGLRNVIQNAALAFNPPSQGSISAGAVRGEMVSYCFIHAPAISLTGSISAVTPVVSVRSNYLWWSDLSNVLIDQLSLNSKGGKIASMNGTFVTPEMMAKANNATTLSNLESIVRNNPVIQPTVAEPRQMFLAPVPGRRKLGLVSNALKAGGKLAVKALPWLGEPLSDTYGHSHSMPTKTIIERIKRFIWSLMENMSPLELGTGALGIGGLLGPDEGGKTFTSSEAEQYLFMGKRMSVTTWKDAPPGYNELWASVSADIAKLIDLGKSDWRATTCSSSVDTGSYNP